MDRSKYSVKLFALFLSLSVSVFIYGKEVNFSRDIRPILSDRCFKCHGFDEAARKGDLALHTHEDALKDGAVVPGDAGASEMIFRMISDDPDEVMPPPSSNKPALTKEEIELFKEWINQGAKFEKHWSFIPPKESKVEIPEESREENPIDVLVGKKLQEKGFQFSAPADPYVLIRRLSLDLIGLPPTLSEADEFVESYRDKPHEAIDRAVAMLMTRPEYGEKWAREWLDLARYSDTNGYEKDRERSIWPYRDWVINSLNSDKPYDQFSIEQLAGDMLPQATTNQLIATGFHRNTMLNEESGIDPLEYRYMSMVDRVATTGTVWLGLTTGCAQCHTHKYDPITHTDFYAMMALMNSADEPTIKVPDAAIERKRKQILAKIAKVEEGMMKTIDARKYFQWYREAIKNTADWKVFAPSKMESSRPHLSTLPDGSVYASGDFTKREVYDLQFDLRFIREPITAIRIEPIPDERLPGGGSGVAYYEGRPGDFFLSEVTAKADGKEIVFGSGSVDYGKIKTGFGTAVAENVFDGNPTSGWATGEQEDKRHELVLNLKEPVVARQIDLSLLFQRHFAAGLGRFRVSFTTDRGEILARGGEISNLLKASSTQLMLHYVRTSPDFAEDHKTIEALRMDLPSLPETLVLKEWEGKTRPTHRHHRGEYLEAREEVAPAIPVIFGKLPEDQPANRLTFAKWLVSEDNPLAARVAVNRAWRSFFGHGIVRTAGDYGYQSPLPSHPELLDYLAAKFMREGWSTKQLHRWIVTSRTYQQDSSVTPQMLSMDPLNTYYSRGPRFRMNGEMIRDAALSASGLLTRKIGGPSVRPPQPETVTTVAYGDPKWISDEGPNRFRRSIYTFHKRTAPFAAYLAFDAPTGDSCLPRRDRSNTPLQALTLMNDEMFIETATAIVESVEGTDEEIVDELFRRILTRPPARSEVAILANFYRSQRTRLELAARRQHAGINDDQPEPNFSETAWIMVAPSDF